MTGTRNPRQDGSIQAMLRDSGLEAATELRSTLERMQALVPDHAPAPRADLAALLAGGSTAPAEPAAGTADTLAVDTLPAEALPAGVSSLADRRRGRRRRMALVSGAVVGAMSLGVGAVAAASPDFREDVGHALTVIFQPAAPAPVPAPTAPSPSDLPAAPVPAPAGTSPAGTVPAVPAPEGTAPAAKRPGPASTPPAGGRGGSLPTPGQRPVVPGQNGRNIPGSPLPTVPSVPELPTSSSDLP